MGTDEENKKPALISQRMGKGWPVWKNPFDYNCPIPSEHPSPYSLDVAKTVGRSPVDHPCPVLSDQLQRGSILTIPTRGWGRITERKKLEKGFL